MCGIYGEFLFSGSIVPELSRQKLELLSHRGPDGFGWEQGDYSTGSYTIAHNETENGHSSSGNSKQCNYFLGHRRLSIVDLSYSAFQPMESSDGQLVVIFNGEIYNHLELRRELEKSGSEFRTDHSDTEVLLNAYQLWGLECLQRFRGMFAFSIYDRQRKTIFFARDRIGKKPFYYEFNENKFCFSSELGPLVKLNDTKRDIDNNALYQYLLFGYILHPHSIFLEIKKLPPASFGVVDLAGRSLSIEQYWDISIAQDSNIPFDQYTEEVDNFLTEAVSIRLRADVPVGAFISGGIDSTLVIKKIKEISKKQYDVFGADFPGTVRSEKKYIEEAAAYYGQRLHLSSIDESYAKKISDIAAIFDEPFDGGSSVAVFDLFQNAAKEHIKVVLTGDGGDELFGGYKRYQDFLRSRYILKMFCLPRFLTQVLKVILARIQYVFKGKAYLYSVAGDRIAAFIHMNYDFSLTKLLKNYGEITINDIETIKEISRRVEEENLSDMKAVQYFELKTILPGRMLYKIDRLSMFFGVESRAPILDHKLVEFAFNIPDEHNISLRQTKRVLKAILSQDFPASFVYREKQGFGNPFDKWFSSIESIKNIGILLDEKSLIYKFLSYKEVHNLFPKMALGYKSWRAKQLWRLLMLAHFLENHKSLINC